MRGQVLMAVVAAKCRGNGGEEKGITVFLTFFNILLALGQESTRKLPSRLVVVVLKTAAILTARPLDQEQNRL